MAFFKPIVSKVTNNFGKIMMAGFGISTYKDYREEGRGVLNSVGNTALDLMIPELMGWKPWLAYEAISHIPEAVVSGGQWLARENRELERGARDQSPFRNHTFVDSQQIYTMRQAGLALAEQSKYALQQSLMGDEARFMHR